MHAALAPDLRFSREELELLTRACQLADREAALSALIARDGMTVKGSTGQTVLHPAVTELRLVEAGLCSLLQRVSTDVSAGAMTPRQLRGKNAADARWRAHRELGERRLKVASGG